MQHVWGKRRSACRILVGKSEGNVALGRPRCIWQDNIKMGLKEVEYWDVDWIDLAQDWDKWQALVNAVMNLRVPYNKGNFLTG
jgi:hypothetical protein